MMNTSVSGYSKDNKFTKLAYDANKRSKTSFKIARFELEALWIVQNGVCPYTDKEINLNNSHLEHVVPLSQGGCNTISNCVFVHNSANVAKGSMFLREFCRIEGLDYIGIIRTISEIHDARVFLIKLIMGKV